MTKRKSSNARTMSEVVRLRTSQSGQHISQPTSSLPIATAGRVAPPSQSTSSLPIATAGRVAPPSQSISDSQASGPSSVRTSCSTSSWRRRGNAKGIKDWGNLKNKLLVQFDARWHPVGDSASALQGQLGHLVRHHIPLTYIDWQAVPTDLTDLIWNEVKDNLDNCPDQYRIVCMDTRNKMWRDCKYKTKKKYFVPFQEDPDLYSRCPPGISPPEWRELVDYWRSDSAQAIATRNSHNRELRGPPHTTGRKHFAQIRHQLTKDNKKTDKMSIFKSTRRDNDPDVLEAIDAYNQRLNEVPESQRTDEVLDEIFHAVFGPDAHGYCRTYGGGIPRSMVYPQTSGTSQSVSNPADITELTRQFRESVRDDLKEELRGELKEELRGELREEFRQELRQEMQLMRAGLISQYFEYSGRTNADASRQVADASSGHHARRESVGDDVMPCHSPTMHPPSPLPPDQIP